MRRHNIKTTQQIIQQRRATRHKTIITHASFFGLHKDNEDETNYENYSLKNWPLTTMQLDIIRYGKYV